MLTYGCVQVETVTIGLPKVNAVAFNAVTLRICEDEEKKGKVLKIDAADGTPIDEFWIDD